MFEGPDIVMDVLKLTVMSMTVVFASLLTISFILELFKVLFYDRDIKKKESIENKKSIETTKESVKESVDLSKNHVLAALFTAAVAASDGKKASNLRIRSIRKIS